VLTYFPSRNFPNPFTNDTKITYSQPVAGHINLTLHILMGRQVAVLVDEYKSTGSYATYFIRNNLPAGIYFTA
jgi:hypothetical protein